MAERKTERGRELDGLEGERASRRELSTLVPLVRLLARQAARETWAAPLLEGSKPHD
jgi:hypothetical protein